MHPAGGVTTDQGAAAVRVGGAAVSGSVRVIRSGWQEGEALAQGRRWVARVIDAGEDHAAEFVEPPEDAGKPT